MISQKIVIIGGGGHARIILDCIKAQNKYQPIGYLDDKKGYFYRDNIRYLGSIDSFFKNFKAKFKNENLYFTIAIGDNYIRKKINYGYKNFSRFDYHLNCKKYLALIKKNF